MDKFILVVCVVAWLMTLVPSITYLRTEWGVRRDKLFSTIKNDGALKLYYTQFYPSDVSSISNLQERFKSDFHRIYGRRRYIVPMVLLAAVSGLGMFWVGGTMGTWFSPAPPPGGPTGTWLNLVSWLSPLPNKAVSAFLGAYAWVLLDQFSRIQRRDFTKSDIYNGVYRFLIAVPFAYSLASVAKDELGVAMAFLIGMFPTRTVMKFGQRLFIKTTGITDADADSAGPTELTKMQGIGKENAERLQQIGITTIVELAWLDPIDITSRSNFDFNYVIDCISQALLWIYFEDKTKLLYPLGFRGAQEVISILEQNQDDAKVKAVLTSAAMAIGVDKDGFMNALDQVASDPYAKFINEIWVQ